MGLDITVFTNALKVTDPEKVRAVMEHEDGPRKGAREHNFHLPYINEDFASRAEGVEAVPYKADEYGFCAGSYSAYGSWRKELAGLVGITNIKAFWDRCDELEDAGKILDMPFWQLLYFSDCEGTIGPVGCAALAKVFAEWEDRARAYAEKKHIAEYEGFRNTPDFDERGQSNGKYFWRKYQEWKTAFERGATGWVAFH